MESAANPGRQVCYFFAAAFRRSGQRFFIWNGVYARRRPVLCYYPAYPKFRSVVRGRKRMKSVVIAIVLSALPAPLTAQWLNYLR
jgi:hypothetical protein